MLSYIEQRISEHNLSDPTLEHTNLDRNLCVCYKSVEEITDKLYQSGEVLPSGRVKYTNTYVDRPPNFTGNSCHECGGMMIRTGTCETCTQCATQGGCG